MPDNISYTFTTSDVIVLSATGEVVGEDVTGLLYVPDLEPYDPCYNASAPYIPANVTRQANLPKIDYDLIGIAPWISPQCTQNYFAAARLDPIRGFIFFQPTNTTAPPPAVTDSAWDLGDGGKWKTQNNYPIFAVSGLDGVRLTVESSLYSGNLTGVPYGPQLASLYDPRDYVRLWVDIDTGQTSQFPHLWVFLLVVLGILIAIILSTIVTMRLVQQRRRESLRRRVASGEVDLEALGIKRLTVPQDALNQMPLYTYGQRHHRAGSSPRSSASATTGPYGMTATADDRGEKSPASASSQSSPFAQSRTPNIASNLVQNYAPDTGPTRPPAAVAPAATSRVLTRVHSTYRPTPTSQPTCAICLDDFFLPSSSEPGTLVRELPCHHIFHPECVDSFLRDSSSLCPICKRSALPLGYCPRVITNAMVRRERLVRQIRERAEIDHREDDDEDEDEYVVTSSSAIMGSDDSDPAARRSQPSRREFSDVDVDGSPTSRFARMRPRAFARMRRRSSATALTDMPVADAEVHETSDAATPASPQERQRLAQSRSERARQRAASMLGPLRRAPLENPSDMEQYSTAPTWRKAFRGVFSRGQNG